MTAKIKKEMKRQLRFPLKNNPNIFFMAALVSDMPGVKDTNTKHKQITDQKLVLPTQA